jgi:hypothetical protein
VNETGTPPKPGPPRQRRPRWGVRTLGFLALALVAILTSNSMGGHTIGTLGSLLFGLVGAGYCSLRGINEALEHGILGTLLGRRDPR